MIFENMNVMVSTWILSAFLLTGCSGGGSDPVSPPIEVTPLIEVSPAGLQLSAAGGEQTVVVKANVSWQVSTDGQTWYSLSVKSGYVGETAVKITFYKNSDEVSHDAKLTFTDGANYKQVYTFSQEKGTIENYVPEGYKLVWHDEFNEGTVLSSDWTHEVQKAGWVNNELQSYVNGSADGKRVTELVDGKLSINCFKGSDGKIYSGRVYAKVNTGWLYGYFEARILLPKGKGTWPAFWMMPANNDFAKNPWPDCGEIDIMEEVGTVPNEVSSSIHTKKYNHVLNTQKTEKRNIGTAESEYHIYACEWTPDYLKFFVDGKVLMTFNNEGTGKDVWPFTYNFYPILNLAWGGSWGGMNGVDESALPITMKVDYVRVFQKK